MIHIVDVIKLTYNACGTDGSAAESEGNNTRCKTEIISVVMATKSLGQY